MCELNAFFGQSSQCDNGLIETLTLARLILELYSD